MDPAPRIEQHGDVSVLSFFHDITIGRGDVVLRDCVVELLEQDRLRIVLDLEGVSRMDSAGVGELIACYKRIKEQGGTIKLLNPNQPIVDLLDVAKLSFLFEIFFDAQTAIGSFES